MNRWQFSTAIHTGIDFSTSNIDIENAEEDDISTMFNIASAMCSVDVRHIANIDENTVQESYLLDQNESLNLQQLE